jgi:fatty acid desaturase
VRTSNNFCTDSALWTLLSNGLNFQIEHHLFPGINHEHLWRIAPTVQAACAAAGVEYKSFGSFRAILAETAAYYELLSHSDCAAASSSAD